MNETILLTGGTGSFGQKFTELVLENNHKPIRIYSRGEFLQDEMRKKFDDSRLRFFIGDVRDRDRLTRAMNGADIVVHAAALKQVPACEYNPLEAVKTNIDGAVNIIDCAIDCGVKKVIALSSDKAVQPVNLYGATKMVAEKLFIQGNTYSKDTRFSCVRYGNVLNSRGSIIPLFNEQKSKGTVTITDERMTRFFLTLEQGAMFVLKCLEVMEGGEIFIPKIPRMKIVDVAETIAPFAEKKFTGIRPGEKLHEILITPEEARHTKDCGDYYVIEPEFPFWKSSHQNHSLSEGFEYTSERGTDLTPMELTNLL